MPPKVKVTKESIFEAAFQLLKEHGITKVNARDLADLLHCSVQPIFRSFHQMDNLKRELYFYVDNLLNEFLNSGMSRHRIPFLGIGLAYIDFARKEKNLFKFLFMSDEFKGKNLLQMIRDESNQEIVAIISAMSGLTFSQSQDLFLNIWLITHGIASLMATNDCDLTDEQIEVILMDAFTGFKYQLKKKGEQLS